MVDGGVPGAGLVGAASGQAQKEREPAGVCQAVLLKIIGVSRPTIGEWEKRGCPRNADKTYDLGAVVRWKFAEYEGWLRERTKAAGELERSKARRQEALAAMAEMRVAQMRGQLLPRPAVDAGLIARIQTVKAMLLGMVRRLPTVLEGEDRKTIKRVLEDAVLDMLNKFASGQVALQLSKQMAEAIETLRGGGTDEEGNAA